MAYTTRRQSSCNLYRRELSWLGYISSMNTKYCFKCKTTKDIDDFYHDKSRKDERQTCCKSCRSAWMIANRKKYSISEEAPSQRLRYLQRTAKRRGLAASISLEEYSKLISQHCFYCENKIGAPVLFATGLDRLDCNKGYVSGNCVSCCKPCNMMRGDHFTPEEARVAAQAVIAYRENFTTASQEPRL